MLNNKQLIAFQLIAQGKTGNLISEHFNAAEETISGWRKKTEFIALVNVVLDRIKVSTQQKMRNILFLSLEILEKELIKKNSSVNINLALKIVQNYKISNLINEKIGSESAKNIEKRLFDKKFDEMF